MLLNAYTYTQCELDTALRDAVRKTASLKVLKQLISAGASLQKSNPRTSVDGLIHDLGRKGFRADDISILETLLEAGAVIDDPEAWGGRYHLPISPLDHILLREGYSAQIQRVRSLAFLYSDRQQTTLTVPGIFEAAHGGQEQLHSYLKSHTRPHDDQDRKLVLEVALSEASGRRHAHVVQSLLHFGVDPDVRVLIPFSREFPWRLVNKTWHPILRAVSSGDLNTLRLLVTETDIDVAFLNYEMGAELDLCALRRMDVSQRDQILRVLSDLDLSVATRSKILLRAIRGDDCRHKDCAQFRHSNPDFALVSQLLDSGLAYLDHCEHLDWKSPWPHILVGAIERGCRVPGLSYLIRLLKRQERIIPALSARTLGALAQAALNRRFQGHDILEFLVQNVGGFQSYVQENSSSLLSYFVDVKDWVVYYGNHHGYDCISMATLKWVLDHGAFLRGSALAQLIPHTSESFMLGMIHSLAEVGEVDEVDMFHALDLSIEHGRLNLAVALIEKGAPVTRVPRWTRSALKRTALQQACQAGTPPWFIRFLVEKGADLNVPPGSGSRLTALQAACYSGAQLSCIVFLIEKGADVDAPPAPNGGLTAIQCAASQGLMNITGLLLDHGADVNSLSGSIEHPQVSRFFRFGRALDFAAYYSRLDMVHFLAAAGARSSKPGSTGFDGAIEIATRQGNFAIARLLQEHAESSSGDPMEAEYKWLWANKTWMYYYNDWILPAGEFVEARVRNDYYVSWNAEN